MKYSKRYKSSSIYKSFREIYEQQNFSRPHIAGLNKINLWRRQNYTKPLLYNTSFDEPPKWYNYRTTGWKTSLSTDWHEWRDPFERRLLIIQGIRHRLGDKEIIGFQIYKD